MTQKSIENYAALKRSVYREYSRSYDEDRDRFVSGQLLRQVADRTQGKGVLVGLDLTPDMLRLARLELGGRVNLVEGNAATGLPFREKSFDVVTSLNLVQELPTNAVTPLFDGVYRILRPGRRVPGCDSMHGGQEPSRRHVSLDGTSPGDLWISVTRMNSKSC
jgi:SAM-dependent methyltransferase